MLSRTHCCRSCSCSSRERTDPLVDEQIEQRPRLRLVLGRGHPLVQADGRVSSRLPERVDGLMSGDRIKPGTKRTAILVQPALQVDLEERVLEHVVRERRIAEVTCQVAVQLSFVAMDQFGDRRLQDPSSRYRLMSSSSVSGARSVAESDPMALTMLRTAAAESSS